MNKKIFKSLPVVKKDSCKCGSKEEIEEHTCPFASDVWGDNTTLCTCCEDCTYECAMDI
jgi:hypothetical protein